MQYAQGGEDVQTALSKTAPTMLAFNGKLAQLGRALPRLPDVAKQYGGWFRAIGSFQSTHGQGAAPGYSGRTGGFLSGLDRAFGDDLILGFAMGYSHTDLSQSDGTTGSVDTPRALVYAAYRIGQLSIEGTLGAAYDRIGTNRPVAALGANAIEGHNGFEQNVALQAAYALPMDGFTVIPRGGIQYVRLSENKFAETGANGFNMSSNGNVVESLQPIVGVSIAKTFTPDDAMKLTPELKASFSHELMSTSRNVVLTTAAGSAANVQGVSAAENTLTLGPTLTAHFAGDLELIADYKLTLGLGKSVGHTIFAGARQGF